MKEKIFKNFSLKVLSVVCAVILWTIVVNVYDPNTSYTFSNVTVQLINTESLTNRDYTYEVVDGGRISVYVSGPKSIVTDLTASDIVATADLSEISAFADYVDINVQIIKNGQVVTGVEATPRTSAVRLNIENRVTQNFDIEIETTGSLAEGYRIISQSVSPNTVRITGSSSLIASIVDVKAVVDISGFSTNISRTVGITLHDAEGNEISVDGLELSKADVEYYGEVQTSKIVPVRYSLTGNAATGYSVNSVSLSHEQVEVAGTAQNLESLEEIVIPANLLDVTNLTDSKVFTIDLSQLISKELIILSGKNVEVDVEVTESYSRRISVEASQIQFTGLASGYSAVANGDLTIQVMGLQTVVDALQTTNITMTASLAGLSEGTHTVPVTVSLPTGCTVSGTYTVEVTITNNEQSTATQ